MDLVKVRTAIMIFKERNNALPENIQKMFQNREEIHNLSGKLNFNQPRVRTTLKSMCMSVCGVTLWNSLDEEIKQSSSTIQFKNRFKKTILVKYKNKDH